MSQKKKKKCSNKFVYLLLIIKINYQFIVSENQFRIVKELGAINILKSFGCVFEREF